MFAKAQQQQSKAHNEAMHRPASRIPSMPSAGPPNSVLLSLLGNVDSPTNQPNKTGLPDALKARFERLAGMPLDDVRVHRNSDRPADLGALAYAQGNEIHLGPGQEKHLEHELGHVVQQKQGRVMPTTYSNDLPINEDHSLEQQSDHVQLQCSIQSNATNGQLNIIQMKKPSECSEDELKGYKPWIGDDAKYTLFKSYFAEEEVGKPDTEKLLLLIHRFDHREYDKKFIQEAIGDSFQLGDGPEIPKIIHRFWSGGPMTDEVLQRLLQEKKIILMWK